MQEVKPVIWGVSCPKFTFSPSSTNWAVWNIKRSSLDQLKMSSLSILSPGQLDDLCVLTQTNCSLHTRNFHNTNPKIVGVQFKNHFETKTHKKTPPAIWTCLKSVGVIKLRINIHLLKWGYEIKQQELQVTNYFPCQLIHSWHLNDSSVELYLISTLYCCKM